MAVDEFGREIRGDQVDKVRKRARSHSPSPASTRNEMVYDRDREYSRSHRRRQYPCDPYIDANKPLFCKRLWAREYRIDNILDGDNVDPTTSAEEMKPDESKVEDDGVMGGGMENDVDEQPEREILASADDNANTDNTPLETQMNEKYNSYVQEYCLSYTRSFLNIHLDDEFFVDEYSPLEKHRKLEKLKELKENEAKLFHQQYNPEDNQSLEGLMLHSYERLPMMSLDVPCRISEAMIQESLLKTQARDGIQINMVSTDVDPLQSLKRTVHIVTNDDGLLDSLSRERDVEVQDADEKRTYLRIIGMRRPVDASLVPALTLSGMMDVNEAAEIKQKLTTLSIMISRALDTDTNLATNNSGIDALVDPDLEVVAAYLRRVHYFDVASAKQLTLSDIVGGAALPEMKIGGQSGMDVAKLSAFLDHITGTEASMSKNLSETNEVIQEMLSKEEMVKQTWVSDHSVLTEDGRARCAFRYCTKLFKSANFLEKHLFKKHFDEMKREQLKMHDDYIMKQWEQDNDRKCLPLLCIDCGPEFGIKEVVVKGSAPKVQCVDPEPELMLAREEQEQQHIERMKQQELSRVDVDDMVEEKVELKFDKLAEDAFPIKKKKKKKRKI
mmetsp:Transcript_21779/g.32553  ORF Transcript_21779/g.32553 Transcript_21779/m.32553 type:complete len:614 (-) Transcript_21779:37-1878(-)